MRSRAVPSRVQQIVGICEEELIRLNDRSRYIESGEELSFVNGTRKTPIGSFNVTTVKQLRGLLTGARSVDTPPKQKQCEFEILNRVDIGQLQSQLTTEQQALVQVASNFNCLEVGSRFCPPDHGCLVEEAHQDVTQGPAACFGPLSAYLYRAHFVFPNYEGQTETRQLNLLQNVGEYLGTPMNGKLTLLGKEKIINDDEIDKIVENVGIGLHTNCPVLYGRKGALPEPHARVDQVFSASINTKDYGAKIDSEQMKRVLTTLLRAAYQGAYLSSIAQKRKTLFLTLVGGGVFYNPINLICEEILRAHKEWADHPNSELEKVYLCMFKPDSTVDSALKELLKS